MIIPLIKLYQRTVSPDHGWFKAKYPYGFCRYYPSCSEYTIQSIEAKGTMKGIVLGLWRVVRCNPFIKPRIDKAPKSDSDARI